MLKIIAECGVNWHNLTEAMDMIKRAKAAGCWAAKFQLYDESALNKEGANYDFLKSIMLSEMDAQTLNIFGRILGIRVFFTPMYLKAVEWCEHIYVEYYKIRYADNEDRDLILKILDNTPPTLIFVSVGPDKYPDMFKKTSYKKLLCVPNYPAKRYDYGLPANFWTAYQGVSDHTPGTAFIKELLHTNLYFEKHVKLDNNCIEAEWAVTFDELAEVLST